MLNRPPPTRSAFDNDECHVMAFRPISEAHGPSYNTYTIIISNPSPLTLSLQAFKTFIFSKSFQP